MKESKIPTAKELLNDNFLLIENGMTCEAHTHLVVKQMVEFAKLHVEAALKAAATKAFAERDWDWIVNKDSILNSYSDELIK